MAVDDSSIHALVPIAVVAVGVLVEPTDPTSIDRRDGHFVATSEASLSDLLSCLLDLSRQAVAEVSFAEHLA